MHQYNNPTMKRVHVLVCNEYLYTSSTFCWEYFSLNKVSNAAILLLYLSLNCRIATTSMYLFTSASNPPWLDGKRPPPRQHQHCFPILDYLANQNTCSSVRVGKPVGKALNTAKTKAKGQHFILPFSDLTHRAHKSLWIRLLWHQMMTPWAGPLHLVHASWGVARTLNVLHTCTPVNKSTLYSSDLAICLDYLINEWDLAWERTLCFQGAAWTTTAPPCGEV